MFVDSKDKWMSIWERGDYTAMMMSMIRFMMIMMTDAFSFSYIVGMTFLWNVVPQLRWIFSVYVLLLRNLLDYATHLDDVPPVISTIVIQQF